MAGETIITKLEKGRAEFAYEKVKEVLSQDKKIQKEYRSYVKRLPQMILSNGLGQTIAFVFSKKAKKDQFNAYNFVYNHISQYLESENTTRIKKDKSKPLEEWVISLNSLSYRYATEEVLAFLNWLRRFADGMIETDEES